MGSFFAEFYGIVCCSGQRVPHEALQRGGRAREFARYETWRADGGPRSAAVSFAGGGDAPASPAAPTPSARGRASTSAGGGGRPRGTSVSFAPMMTEAHSVTSTLSRADSRWRLNTGKSVRSRLQTELGGVQCQVEDGVLKVDGVPVAPGLRLLAAARAEQIELVRYLLAERREDINQVDDEGVTPLLAVSAMGHEELVAILIEAGADVNASDVDGVTPLQAAAFDGYAGVVRRLLVAGAKVDAADSEGCTALYLAAGNATDPEHEEVVELLLAREANPLASASDGSTPLIVAEELGNLRVIEALRRAAGFEEGRRKKRATRVATQHPKGMELRTAGSMFLGMLDLEKAVNGKPVESEASMTILDTDKLRAVEGRDGDERDNALHTAAKYGKVEVVRHLLRGAIKDVDKLNGEDLTALYLAAERGRADVVAVLLEAGVDKDLPDKDGVTPLSVAARKGHYEVVAELCRAGADLEEPDDKGVTPLIAAAASGFHITGKALVHARANLEARTEAGRTALHFAAFGGHREMVQYLLEACALAAARDKEGLTPLDLAAESPRSVEELQELLRDALQQQAHNLTPRRSAVA